YRDAADLSAGLAKVLQVFDVGFSDALQQLPRRRSLQRQRGNLFGDVLYLHVKPDCILPEPTQVGVSRSPAIAVIFQPCDGAVVDDLALFVAPAAVDHLIDGDLVDVAGDDAVDKARGIAP